MDRTVAYVEMGRGQAAEEGLTVEFVHEDMRRFCRPEAFDGAPIMITSFGYFADWQGNRRVLAEMHVTSARNTASAELTSRQIALYWPFCG